MSQAFWRPGEPGGAGRSGYQAATVCKRGHPADYFLERDPGEDLGYCPKCGARILSRCGHCGTRIRGDYYAPGVIGFSKYKPPPFCDGCGSPHPWAGREQRIYELENLLDEEDIDAADRLVVQEALEWLREQPAAGDKEQLRRWRLVKDKAPGLLAASGQRIAESVMTAYVKAQLGL